MAAKRSAHSSFPQHVAAARCRHVRVGGVVSAISSLPSPLSVDKFFLVRVVHQYYAAVRLLRDVHAGLVALAFTHRPAATSAAGIAEVSRFSCMKFPGVLWVLRLRGTAPGLALRALAHAAFHHLYSVGIPIARFRSSIAQPACTPVYASPSASR